MFKSGAVLLLALFGVPQGALPPEAPGAATTAVLKRIMELNRSGRWTDAATLAEELLVSGSALPEASRCEAYCGLAYSQVRLGRDVQARRTLEAYKRSCTSLSSESWLPREVEKLEAELVSRSTARTPAVRDAFWRTAPPAALGLDVEALDRHERLCEDTGADACFVVYRGKIVQEWYSPRYHEPMYAMSSTKSITGLLVGMLVGDGRIPTLEEPVCTYVEEWCNGRKRRVTLRHLLSMTSGLPRLDEGGVGYVRDKNPYVVGLPLRSEPGARWDYSNEGVQLLSPILDRAAGQPIEEYARKRLFEPLGMLRTRLRRDEQGHAWTYADMETTPRELARIGLLMLNKGVWQGRPIVSEDWIGQSTRPSQRLNPRYGLLWWLYPEGFGARGHLDNNLYVFPGRELIVVRMQSAPGVDETGYHSMALGLFERFVKAESERPPRRAAVPEVCCVKGG